MQLPAKIGLSVAIVAAGAALVGLAYHFNPVDDPVDDSDATIFKRAHNRIVTGFEKEHNQEWKKDFSFVQAADPQFGLIERFQYAENYTDFVATNWTEDRKLLRLAVDEWNHLKPRFVIICGDLANDNPKSFNSKSKRREQLDDLKQELRRLTVPVLFMGGNHDLLDVPTREALKEYTDEFGDDYYSFWLDSVLFLVLNSQLYKNHSLMEEEYQKQNEWLKQQLPDGQNATHVVVFQHIPWFLHDWDKQAPDGDYFEIELEERKAMLKQLYNDGKVRWIFAGHYHRNAEGTYNGDLQMITTSAIGAQMKDKANAKSGYRVVKVTQTGISHQYKNITESNSSEN